MQSQYEEALVKINATAAERLAALKSKPQASIQRDMLSICSDPFTVAQQLTHIELVSRPRRRRPPADGVPRRRRPPADGVPRLTASSFCFRRDSATSALKSLSRPSSRRTLWTTAR